MMKQNKKNRLTIRLDDNELNQVNINASISGILYKIMLSHLFINLIRQ